MPLLTFEASLQDLIDALPAAWATGLPDSEIAYLLQAVSEIVDDLSAKVEQIAADQVLATAGADGLQRQWALLYGAENEQLPPTLTALRAYLQARAQEDGSTESLYATLLSLLQDPANAAIPDRGGFVSWDAAGDPLHWAADSSGVHFSGVGKVEIIENTPTHTFTVQVHSGMTYDTAAFARAVDRFRPAHNLPATITVV